MVYIIFRPLHKTSPSASYPVSAEPMKWGQPSASNGWDMFGSDTDTLKRRSAEKHYSVENDAFCVLWRFWRRIEPKNPFASSHVTFSFSKKNGPITSSFNTVL